jgi:tetratricopeptide (TPR) repeat protein
MNRLGFLKNLGIGAAAVVVPTAVVKAQSKPQFQEDDYDYDFGTLVAKNKEGIAAEANGDYERAIELYEQVVNANFVGSHPYRRLDILYRKFGMTNHAKAVCRRAINMLKQERKTSKRKDIEPKLHYFYNQLENAGKMKNKKLQESKSPVILVRKMIFE